MGDLVLVINNPIIMSGVHKDVPVVIDIEDKITALSELFTNENRIKCIFRGMKNMIGEISNMASSYHNKITNSEARKQEYESYIDLLSVCNGRLFAVVKPCERLTSGVVLCGC